MWRLEVEVVAQDFRVKAEGRAVNPRKLEHGFRRICARIPYALH